MARHRRYRRYYRRRSNWSSRINELNISETLAANGDFFIQRDLVTNPAQTDNNISNKFTVKNVRAELEAQVTSSEATAINFVRAYIMFVPQGVPVNGSLPTNHPEWIMAYRWVGSPVANGSPYFPALRLGSRLSRNLDTGDRITFIIIGSNTDVVAAGINCNGLVRYNTKAI